MKINQLILKGESGAGKTTGILKLLIDAKLDNERTLIVDYTSDPKHSEYFTVNKHLMKALSKDMVFPRLTKSVLSSQDTKLSDLNNYEVIVFDEMTVSNSAKYNKWIKKCIELNKTVLVSLKSLDMLHERFKRKSVAKIGDNVEMYSIQL